MYIDIYINIDVHKSTQNAVCGISLLKEYINIYISIYLNEKDEKI